MYDLKLSSSIIKKGFVFFSCLFYKKKFQKYKVKISNLTNIRKQHLEVGTAVMY